MFVVSCFAPVDSIPIYNCILTIENYKGSFLSLLASLTMSVATLYHPRLRTKIPSSSNKCHSSDIRRYGTRVRYLDLEAHLISIRRAVQISY
jgi:hypothetical protein